MVGSLAQSGQRRGQGGSSLRLLLGGHLAGADEHQVRPQLVGQGEGRIGAADPLVELVGRVEAPPGGQAERHERELDRAEHVAKVAAARLAQPLRGQLADGLDAPRPGRPSGPPRGSDRGSADWNRAAGPGDAGSSQGGPSWGDRESCCESSSQRLSRNGRPTAKGSGHANAAVEAIRGIDDDRFSATIAFARPAREIRLNTMASSVLSSVVHQVLDLPADRLAAIIGAWPEPAILASGPGFGEAGRWSLYTAFPRLVFEATDRHWTHPDGFRAVRDRSRRPARASWRGSPADSAWPIRRTRRLRAVARFQGGLIGFLGYDLAPLLERLPRKAPRDSRLPDLRMALYDTAVIVDHHSGRVVLRAWDLTGEGREATERRCRSWRQGPAERDRISPADPRPRRWDRSPATSAATPISSGCAGRSSTSRRETCSRSTSRSGSRPTGRSSRWISSSG